MLTKIYNKLSLDMEPICVSSIIGEMIDKFKDHKNLKFHIGSCALNKIGWSLYHDPYVFEDLLKTTDGIKLFGIPVVLSYYDPWKVELREYDLTHNLDAISYYLRKQELNSFYGIGKANNMRNKFEIDRVIFNDPATIIIWKDGTKTVVKCQEGDAFDPEKGMAMAISKRALGDKGNFNDVFKYWL